LDPDNFGARIAFVDYDGKKAFDDYTLSPPKSSFDGEEFVKTHAPRIIRVVISNS
jgi:hypothetical protein